MWWAILSLLVPCGQLADAANSRAGAEAGCSPGCPAGGCFAGRCLHVGQDLEGFGRAAPAAAGRPGGPHRLQLAQLAASTHRAAPAAPSTPLLRTQAEPALRAAGGPAAAPEAEPPLITELLSKRAGPPQQLDDGVHGILQQQENPEMYVQDQLLAARKAQEATQAENERLRGELQRWRAAGIRVARHEAQAAQLISLARGAPRGPAGGGAAAPAAVAGAAPAPEQGALSMLSESLMTFVFNSGKEPLTQQMNAYRILAIFFFVNAALFVSWYGSQWTQQRGKAKASQLATGPQDIFSEAIQKGAAALRAGVDRGLQRAGISGYVLELSELQLGNFPGAAVDLSLRLRVGRDEQRTKARESAPGSLSARFGEVFRVEVGKDSQGKCVFSVVDEDAPTDFDRIASVEIPLQELLSFAQREHGEYFNFELSMEARGLGAASAAAGPRGGRPYLAMRICDARGAAPCAARQAAGPSPRQMDRFT